MVASLEAVTDSGIDFSKEDAVSLRRHHRLAASAGSTNSKSSTPIYMQKGPSRIGPFVIPKMIANSAAGKVSIHFGLMGPNTAVSTACASAANAIGDAFRAIQYDHADVMITGGSEAGITHMGLGGFVSARALSMRNDDPPGASRPFDKDRDGFVLAEGAGIIIIEELEHARRRGAKIYAELLGVGCTADALPHHRPAPRGRRRDHGHAAGPQGRRLNPDDVGYHQRPRHEHANWATRPRRWPSRRSSARTPSKLAISSTKSMLGHTAGRVRRRRTDRLRHVACKHGVLHPTINHDTPDPTCDLDYVPNHAARSAESATPSPIASASAGTIAAWSSAHCVEARREKVDRLALPSHRLNRVPKSSGVP